jgi:PAS domain S-box-containing protein
MPIQTPDDLHDFSERLDALQREAARTAEELCASEERFRLSVDAAPVLMWMAGPDALCTYFNKGWLDFTGRTLAQELGNGWAEGVHPADLERCIETYMAAFNARREFRMQYRLRRHDGEYCWIIDTGVPRYEPAGAFAGYIGCGTELPSQESLEQVPAIRPFARKLSAREQQVLVLIAEGNSTKQIAQALNITYKTADSHRTNLLKKLDVHETATLVRYAVRMGLVEP